MSNCIRKQPKTTEPGTTDLNKELREKAPIFQKKHRVVYFNLIDLLYVPFIQEMESKCINNKQSPECKVQIWDIQFFNWFSFFPLQFF